MKEADSAATNFKQEAIDPPRDSNDSVKVAAADPAQINFAYTVAGPTFRGRPFEPSTTVRTSMSRRAGMEVRASFRPADQPR